MHVHQVWCELVEHNSFVSFQSDTLGRLLYWKQRVIRHVGVITTRSISLEIKDKLDIGRYEQQTSGSRHGFFLI